MDHLRKPSSPVRSIEVPYFEFDSWKSDQAPAANKEPWTSKFFPKPSWTNSPETLYLSEIVGCLSRHDVQEIRAARAWVQRLAFFEFLRYYLNLYEVVLYDERYIRRQGRSAYISTTYLSVDISRWDERAKVEDSGGEKPALQAAREAVNRLNALLHSFGPFEQSLFGDTPVLFALQILWDTITHQLEKHPCNYAAFSPRVYGDKYVSTRMIQDGWCPRHVRTMNRTPYWSLYAFQLGPLIEQGFHHKCCSRDACIAYQVDENGYPPQHAFKDCQCTLLEIDSSELCRILEQDSFAVLEVHIDDGIEPCLDNMQIKVVSYQEALRYTAISHVWAHGAGNTAANAIHKCQVARILRYIKGLQPLGFENAVELLRSDGSNRLHIWIDTLCVPVQPKRNRHQAIMKMRQIYKSAAQVLVIDQGLMTVKSMDPLDVLVRVATAAWSSRLWTLQEGMLADALFVSLADGPVSIRDIFRSAEDLLSEDIFDATALNFSGMDYLLSADPNTTWQPGILFRLKGEARLTLGPSRLKLLQSSAFLFENVWNQFSTRSTNKPADQYICFATILGIEEPYQAIRRPIEIEEGEGLTDEAEMMALFYTLGTVPRAIFTQRGPRLRKPGWHWAPATFMSGYGPSMLAGIPLVERFVGAVVTDKGLLMTIRSVVFEESLKSLKTLIELRDPGDRSASSFTTSLRDARWIAQTLGVNSGFDTFWPDGEGDSEILKPAIIFMPCGRYLSGALVSIQGGYLGEGEGILVADYICAVEVRYLRPAHVEVVAGDEIFDVGNFVTHVDEPKIVYEIDPFQKWLIR